MSVPRESLTTDCEDKYFSVRPYTILSDNIGRYFNQLRSN